MTESLNSRVRRIARRSGSRNPREIIALLLEELPAEQYRAALEEALHGFVRQILIEDRPSGKQLPTAPPAPAYTPQSTAPVPVPSFRAPGAPAPAVHHPAPKPRTSGFHGSVRVREGWQRALDASVVGADGTHKRLRECTRPDLEAIAARLDKQAEESQRRARGYREVARQMSEHGVTTVDEFDTATKMALFGGTSS